jgi:hypothetical protein
VKRALPAVLLAGVLAAGCASTGSPAGGSSPASVTAAAKPAGCPQAVLVIAAVRGELEASPDQGTFQQADHQLNSLAKSVPGQLKLDVLHTAVDLARFNYDSLTGQDANADASRTFADLAKITRECR